MDYYKLLGVEESATKEEITKAYYKQAKRYHPDKNHAANAKDKMSAVIEAYEVLQDDRKRENYDMFDLPKTRSANRGSHSRSHSQRHTSHRNLYDDRFFTGSSESCRAEQRYKSTLDEIQRINSKLLDEFNARRRRHPGRQTTRSTSRRTGGSHNIMPDKTDDEYEQIVLNQLRALGRH